MVKSHARTIVEMNMVHAAAVGANAAAVIALEPGDNAAVLAARWMKINSPARSVQAAFSGAGDPCASAVSRDDPHGAELLANLCEPLFEKAWQAACAGRVGGSCRECRRCERHEDGGEEPE